MILKKSTLLKVVLLIIAIGSIFIPFLLKKQDLLGNDLFLHCWRGWLDVGEPDFFRLLPRLYFTLVFPIFKFNASYYLGVNSFVHLINVVLMFTLLKYITERDNVALIAALIFAVHYVHSGVTLHVVFICELLSVMFSLVSFLSFVKFRTNYRNSSRVSFYIISVLAFTFSVFSRATSLSLPFIILSYDLLWKDSKEKRRFVLFRNIPFFLIGGIYAFFSTFVFKYMENAFDRFNYIINHPKAVIIHCVTLFKLLFTPFDFQGYSEHFGGQMFHSFSISLFLLVIFLFATFLGKSRAYKFSMLWTLLSSLYIAIGSRLAVQEKNIYFPIIGSSFVLGLLITNISHKIASFKNWKLPIVEYVFTLALLVPLFMSMFNRGMVRTEVGQIVHNGLTTIMKSASSKSNTAVIYAFNFPISIKRCPAFSEHLRVSLREYSIIGMFADKLMTIDCRYGRRPPSTALYAMTMQRIRQIEKLQGRTTFWFPNYKDWFGIDEVGIDSYIPKHYTRFAFVYREGKVLDLTDRYLPKTEIIFKVKGQKINRISIIGDFNNWDENTNPLRQESDGYWTGSLMLSPNKYLYQFLINGSEKIANPNSKYYADEPMLGKCSILTIVNTALPIGLLPTGDNTLDKEIIYHKEKLLINPEDAHLHNRLGQIYKGHGFLKEADLELEEARRLSKEQDEILAE